MTRRHVVQIKFTITVDAPNPGLAMNLGVDELFSSVRRGDRLSWRGIDMEATAWEHLPELTRKPA